MKDIIDSLKKAGMGLAVIALTSLPLSAQKYESVGHSSKYSYSLSKECRDYNKNVYSKSLMGKPIFLNKDARHYSKKVNSNRMHDDYKGIAKQEKKYKAHLNSRR